MQPDVSAPVCALVSWAEAIHSFLPIHMDLLIFRSLLSLDVFLLDMNKNILRQVQTQKTHSDPFSPEF